jgi:hypothetical protein
LRRTALIAAIVVAGGLLAPVAAHADALPTITITTLDGVAPSPGQAVSGITTVHTSAATDAAGTDTISTVELFADATLVATDPSCSGSPSCTSTLVWDATGLSGAHTLSVVVTATTTGVGSDSVTVSVSSPAPTASILSPGSGANVDRQVSVQVQGRVDPSQSDYPTSVDLTVDGTTVGSFVCPGTSRTCTGPVSWDSTAANATVTFAAVAHTHNGLNATSTGVTVNVVNPGPSVSITNPASAATVSGTVVVDVAASTDGGLTDFPVGLSLLVDGTVVDSRSCTLNLHDCTQPLSWDATGVTGSHTLLARLQTSKTPGSTDSTGVTVNVTTPDAVVLVVGPAAGTVPLGTGATTTSSGIVRVPITVGTDLGQNEFPGKVELLVNARVVGSATCPALVHSCSLTILWDARKSAGASDLAARMTSSRSVTSTSRTVTVYARSGSRTTVLGMTTANYRGVATVRGRVLATNTNAGASGVLVRLVRVPAIGKAAVVYVRTGFGGVFAYRFRAVTNTIVTAAVGGGWIGHSKGIQTQLVRAPLVCTAVSTVRASATGTGRCTARYLPARTQVYLRYYFRGRWATLAPGRTKLASVFKLGFVFPVRGTYLLRVTVTRSKVYAVTLSRLMKVVVR